MKKLMVFLFVIIVMLSGCSSRDQTNPPVQDEKETLQLVENSQKPQQQKDKDVLFNEFVVYNGIHDDVLGYPVGIHVDEHNNIYVIDIFSVRGMIKRFGLQGEFIDKFGSKTDGLQMPIDLTTDSQGNVYVADLDSRSIHVFDARGNYERTIEFTEEDTSFIPRNIEILKDDKLVILNFDEVLIMTTDGEIVKRFGESGTKPGQFGAEASEFYLGPNGLAVDEDDNIYVADTLNKRIQIFNREGRLLKVIDNDVVEGVFTQLLHIEVDSNKNMYVTDSGLYHVLKINQQGKIIARIGGMGSKEGSFGTIGSRYDNYGPTALSISNDDLLYVVDVYNHRVECFDSKGEFLYVLGRQETPEAFIYPRNIDVDSNNSIYLVGGDAFMEDPLNFKVLRLDSDGSFITEYISGYNSGEFVNPRDICSFKAYVYVLDLDMVQKFNVNGSFDISFGGRGKEAGYFGLMDLYGIVKGPSAIFVDDEGNVYVADKYNNRVQKFDFAGRFLMEIKVPKPQELFVKGDNMFVLSAVDGTIYKYDVKGKLFDKFINTEEVGIEFGIIQEGSDMEGPQGLAIDALGNVYVSDTFNNRIVVFSPQGELEKVIETFGEGETFNEPRGLALDREGNLYVADFGNHRIVKLIR